MTKVIAYCDGGCRGNQSNENIGGWGVVLNYKDKSRELSGAIINTTNNKMELTAVIEALAVVSKKFPIEVVSDSKYVVDAINKHWVEKWQRNGWLTSAKTPVKNIELWKKLIALASEYQDIKFRWVKGHQSSVGNNRADELANMAMSELENTTKS